MNSKIGEKLEWRNQQELEYNMKLFEKNTLKRSQWEKKYKKTRDEDQYYKDIESDRKLEKL